jgi:hypothetical protein
MLTDFIKLFNDKFHENPFSGSQVVTYGQTDGQINVVKLIHTFCKFLL